MRKHALRISSVLALGVTGLFAACQTDVPSGQTQLKSDALKLGSSVSTKTSPPETLPNTFPAGEVVAYYGDAVLSELETDSGRIGILRLTGTYQEMGQQYGYLVGPRVDETYTAIMGYLGEEMGGKTAAQAERILGPLLDQAYTYLEPHIPQQFLDELSGISTGASLVQVNGVGPSGVDMRTALERMIALSNTSDLNAFNDGGKAVLKMLKTGTSSELDQFYAGRSTKTKKGWRAPEASQGKMFGRTCSFFAAWGARTQEGKLFASRNLDWSYDTGIASGAQITIYAPTDGYAYATFGYAGFIGALAGMNEAGVVVSEVGSNSVLETLKGEPWPLKFREILASTGSVSGATDYMLNRVSDGFNRPNTLGYNFMVAHGDPAGNGANASAAVFETNGGVTSVFTRGVASNRCAESTDVFHFNESGTVDSQLASTSSDVNREADAKEIDSSAVVRKFQYQDGEYIRDAEGYLIEDPYGQPLTVGRPLECAVFRGDEAMMYGTRRYQTAANGPSGEDTREVMYDSGSYNNRYLVQQGILNAYWTGSSYSHDGVTYVNSGSAGRLVGAEEAINVSRGAAMDSNILSVVYDATGLKAYVAYEAGSGESWVRAADTTYTPVDIKALFEYQP